MIVPLPFSRAIYLYGEPIFVPREGNVEEWRHRIEVILNALANEADAQFDNLWKEGRRE